MINHGKKERVRRGEARREGGEVMRRRSEVLGAIHSLIKMGDESRGGQVPNRARQGWSAATWEPYTPLILYIS